VRQSYLKNAALMTGADVLLRLAGMGLRIWLANALGGEGMGLYQLVLAVYSLFVTLATAGVSVAATRLMAEELGQNRAQARGMLVRLLAAAAGLGCMALAGQLALAQVAAQWWLGDVRAAPALRAAAFGMPWMAVSAVLRGFFVARRQVKPNVCSQLVEQTVRISAVVLGLGYTAGGPLEVRCAVVMGCTALSEGISAGIMLLFYRREVRRYFKGAACRAPRQPGRRIWEILWPVGGGRCLASALHTAENMLVPACLGVYLAGAGGRSAAVAQYGSLKGMALPLLTFPFGLLGSLSVLLMPEITQAQLRGEQDRLAALLDRMLRLTGYFSALAAALFWVWGVPLAQRRGRFLPACPGPCHALDVPGKYGGWSHEGTGGAEGGVPLQRVGFHPAHCGGGVSAATFWDERVPLCDPGLQSLYLRSQYRTAALGVWSAAAMDALAGGACTVGAGGVGCGAVAALPPGTRAGAGQGCPAGGIGSGCFWHSAGRGGSSMAPGSGGGDACGDGAQKPRLKQKSHWDGQQAQAVY